MTRGYIIVAQNSGSTNYIKCADLLCWSIKNVMPSASVTLLTDKNLLETNFDNVVVFPHGDYCKNDEWKLANDWQVFDASPYDQTIKLEADLYLPRSIDHWWDILQLRDVVVSTTIRDYSGKVSISKFYRKIFVDNGLPNVYNAVTYYNKSQFAKKFFELVKDIFLDWDSYKSLLRGASSERATTDLVYAIAVRLLGEEYCTIPKFTDMCMVHMKQQIIGTTLTDWSRELIYEVSDKSFRIATIPQLYPVHYHVKSFADKMLGEL